MRSVIVALVLAFFALLQARAAELGEPLSHVEALKCPSGDFMSRMNRLSGAPS